MNAPFSFVPAHSHMTTSVSQPPWRPLNPAMMSSVPAYTAVSARQSFRRPESTMTTTVPPPPPPEAKKKPDRQWPEPVRHYVQRCFAEGNNIAGIVRQEMETKLKQVITEAAGTDTLDTIDWYSYPLPQQMIQSERATMYLTMPLLATNNGMSNLNVQDTNGLSYGTSSKKRKSNDYEDAQTTGMSTTTTVPPWRENTNNTGPRFGQSPDKRSRFDSPSKSKTQASETRKRRFEALNSQPAPYVSSPVDASAEAPRGPIIGRSQTLEKKYFRLTAPPNPETVRPLPILEQTLELLKKKWKVDNNYGYICDQFKSLRQDLTVQHIKADFTVKVYEIHARIALEKGDMGEYNQCQTQLRLLYKENLGGHPTEFKAYRILYFLYTCNRMDMNDALADLTTAEKSVEAVKHALDARSSLALGNYHRFFRLYQETPNMGAYLMDMFVARERTAALANMARSYKPNLKLRFVTEELGFESDEHAARFICDLGGQDFLEEKEGEVRLATNTKCASVFEGARKAAFQKVDLKGQI